MESAERGAGRQRSALSLSTRPAGPFAQLWTHSGEQAHGGCSASPECFHVRASEGDGVMARGPERREVRCGAKARGERYLCAG